MSGGGTTTSMATPVIPEELKPLFANTAAHMVGLQQLTSLVPFFQPIPQFIPPVSLPEEELIREYYRAAAPGPTLTGPEQLAVGTAQQLQGQFGRPVDTRSINEIEAEQRLLGLEGHLQELRRLPIRTDQTDAGITTLVGLRDLLAPEQAALRAIQGGQALGQEVRGLPGVTGQEQQAQSLLTGATTLSQPEAQALTFLGGRLGQTAGPEAQGLGGLSLLAGGGASPAEQVATARLRELLPPITQPEQVAFSRIQEGFPSINEALAAGQLEQFIQGPMGSSPLTQQSMRFFEQEVVPRLAQDLALRGVSQSGAAAEAFANARTQALVPMIQQELGQRQAAAQQLAQLGSVQAARQQATQGMLMDLGQNLGVREQEAARQLLGAGQAQSERQLAAAQALATLGGGQEARQAQMAQAVAQIGAGGTARQLSAAQGLAGLGATLAERPREDIAQTLAAEQQAAQALQTLGGAQRQGTQVAGEAWIDLGSRVLDRLRQDQQAAFQQQLAQAQALGGLGTEQAQRVLAANQLAAQTVGGTMAPLAQIGATQGARFLDTMGQALQAQGLPRTLQTQQFEAFEQDLLRRQDLIGQLFLGPLGAGLIPASIGQRVNQRTSGGGLFGK